MDCIVLAGGIPRPEDPLFPHTQGKPKALIRIGQAAMIEYVLQALVAARNVQKIVIVGIESDGSLTSRYPIQMIPNQGSMMANATAGADWLLRSDQFTGHALFCTSDIPTITGDIIDQFINSCHPFNCSAYYSMVTQEVMEQRFPDSGRTFVKLGQLNVAGGDLVVARPDLAESNREILQLITSGRKHAWKLARIVGPTTLLKYLLHRLTVSDIENRAKSVLGQPVKIIVSPNAEIAMDIDKPGHLSLIQQYLTDSNMF